MKIHTFDQNSTEWENIRKGKITASVFADLISPTNLTPSKPGPTLRVVDGLFDVD